MGCAIYGIAFAILLCSGTSFDNAGFDQLLGRAANMHYHIMLFVFAMAGLSIGYAVFDSGLYVLKGVYKSLYRELRLVLVRINILDKRKLNKNSYTTQMNQEAIESALGCGTASLILGLYLFFLWRISVGIAGSFGPEGLTNGLQLVVLIFVYYIFTPSFKTKK